MFRGKKYKESAKMVDRTVQYDAKDAFDLLIKTSKAKLTRRSSCTSSWASIPVTRTSRSEAPSFCPRNRKNRTRARLL